MSISFNQIPINLRVPGTYIEVDNSQAIQGLLPMPSTILMFGQMLSIGTATPEQPILITRPDQAAALFGRGSMLQHMVEALKGVNKISELYVMPLTDAASATAATQDITIDTDAAGSGTLSLYIGGRRVRVGVTAGDTKSDIAGALAGAISNDPDMLVTASSATGTVTLTANNAGEDAGVLDVRANYYRSDEFPDGVTITIAAPTAGSGNPDMTAALDALGDNWYQTFVMPWSDGANMTLLETELADRFGPIRQIQGHAFMAKNGTVSELSTFTDGHNSPHITCADTDGATINPAFVLASVDAGIDAGEPDPARPRQTLPLPGLLAVPETERRIHSENNTLLFGGIATHAIDAGDIVRVQRLVTMYQVNPAGMDDPSYLDVTTLRTIAYMRYSVRSMVTRKYPRHKLADDGTPIAPGQAIVTPNVMRGELVALFMDWMEIGIAENLEQFKRDLIVERNEMDQNRLDAVIPPDVINQLRVFAGQLQFRL